MVSPHKPEAPGPASYVIAPGGRVRGRIAMPGDKSISHRALLLGGVAEGETRIAGFLRSRDCLATMAALRAMGVEIEDDAHGGELRVRGAGLDGLQRPPADLDCGNSGTAMRLLSGLLAGQPFDSRLVGDASLMRRPMARVTDPLGAMGADIHTDDGRPPISIRGGGRLHGISYRLPVASAQVKSALLLAGLYADGTTVVTEPAPTRDHTERMLATMGVELEVSGRSVTLRGRQQPRGVQVDVPGDLSSAAFFILAGCLAADGELVLENVGVNPTRTGVLEILRLMGADVRMAAQRRAGREEVADLHVRRSRLKGIRVPELLVPLAIDEFPVIFVAAACAEGETVISGAEELRHKESDRIHTMCEALKALGAQVEELHDGARIRGGRLRGGTVHSGGDHRVAMSCAVAALVAEQPVEVADTANVATSFPEFPGLAVQAGLGLESRPAHEY